MTEVVQQVKIQSGEVFANAEGISVLDSALNEGLVLEYSCKTGQCGVCKTTLVSGQVEDIREPLSLTLDERALGQFLTCCSKAKTDITITSENLKALQGIEVKTLPAKISALNFLTDDIVEVCLRFPPTAQFTFLAGQYVDISYQGVRRSYSIASSQTEQGLRFVIKKVEDGQMSDYWFNQAKVGDLLRIEGPKGTFFYRHQAVDKTTVLLATGTGIAPMLSMLNTLEQDERYQQEAPIYLFWGNRTANEFAIDVAFSKLNVHFYRVLSRQDANWQEQTGYVQHSALEVIADMSNTKVYACGSNAMIGAAKTLFIEHGLNESDFHSDAFVQSFS